MGKFSLEIGRRIASLAWGKKYDADLFSNVCEKLKGGTQMHIWILQLGVQDTFTDAASFEH